MNKWKDILNGPEGGPKECPSCGQTKISTRVEDTVVTYGEKENAVEIPVHIPVHHCNVCELDFTDDFAETLKHAAVCRYLNVMTPDEISSIREMYGLSRAEFARLTRLGEASLARWENGNLIQNAAYDQYLFLLTFSENLERLRMREAQTECRNDLSYNNAKPRDPKEENFSALVEAGLFEEKSALAHRFVLRRAG